MDKTADSNINKIIIIYQKQWFIGNIFQILLEQLEINNFNIPYSCRVGICNKCEIQLISGKVRALTNNTLCSNNKILCCSCIPLSNIEIA